MARTITRLSSHSATPPQERDDLAPDGGPATAPTWAPSPHQVRPEHWLWLAVAVMLSLAIRIPFFRIPMLADEGGYAWATRGWLNGTGELYDDLWISRPQGIFFVYAGIFDLFGTGTTAFRFAAWIAIALTVIVVWGFARLCGPPLAATLAALAFAVTSSSPNLEGYSANAEMFMGFPAALSALWLLRISRHGWSRWQLGGVGVLIGVAISIKPSAAVMLAVAIGYITLVDRAAGGRAMLARSGWILAGTTIIGAASLAHGWLLGWDDFFYATIEYRLTAQSAATVGLQHNLEAIGRLASRALALLICVTMLLVVAHRSALAAAARGAWMWVAHPGVPTRMTRWRSPTRPVRHPAPGNNGWLLLRLWLPGSLLGAAIGGDWWPHYLIQVVAPVSICIGCTLVRVLPTLRRAVRLTVAIATVCLLLAPYSVLLRGSAEDMAEAMFTHPGYPAQDAVAAWLRDHSEPGEAIYVAFDQASIYYIADRPPAYRHLYDQELRGIPSSYADLISIIRSPNRPEFIVSTRQPGPFADDSRAFWQEVGEFYEVVETIDDVPIYQDKSRIGDD